LPTNSSKRDVVSKEEKILDQENSQLLQQIILALNEKTGFNKAHEAGVVLSFVNATRTFTITPEASSFEYWIKGTRYTKTAADSVIIDDTEGLWYIYYVGLTLTASQVEWVIKDGNKALVSVIYWDAGNNIQLYLAYEVHDFDMSPATHSYLHKTIGTNFVSGLSLVEGEGGDDGKVAIDGGEIRDEDIHIDIVDGSGSDLFEQELGNTSVFAAAQIPVFYRSGATAWRKYTTGDYPFYDNSGVDNVHYNSYSAPNWASTEAATTAKYIAMWIFGTNDINEPVIAIMGQVESLTLGAAKDANMLENLSFGTLPFEEMKILYRLIFKSNGTHAHTEDLRAISNVPGGTYVPFPSLKPYIDAATMIGAANSEYIVCAYNENSQIPRSIRNAGGGITNIGTANPIVMFVLDLPTNRGGKKLYIDGMKLAILDADENNYVTLIYLYGFTYAGGHVNIDTNETDYTVPQEVVDGYGTVYDVSAYDYVGVKVYMTIDTEGACDIGNPLLDCYYDD